MNLLEPEPRFLGASDSSAEADWVLLGCPLEETVTFRPGTGEGPDAIRAVSEGLETYSPALNRDLGEIVFRDLGDLDILAAEREGDASVALLLSEIRRVAARIYGEGQRLLGLGGEHLISLPLIEAAASLHPGLVVLHLDAHADLRDDYEGQTLSHATVMRRVTEIDDGLVIVQAGIRSGVRSEFEFARRSTRVLPSTPDNLFQILEGFASRPLYLSLDLDVLDPGTLPGTGTPEPGGWTFRELEHVLHGLGSHSVIGADVVELAPAFDPSGISSVTAARCVREILLGC